WHGSFMRRKTAAPSSAFRCILVQTVGDLNEAFAMAQRERVDGIFVQPTSFSRSYRVPMAELALRYRLPSMFGGREYVEAGGLMSYAADYVDLTRRAAAYIDKILKGAKRCLTSSLPNICWSSMSPPRRNSSSICPRFWNSAPTR